MSLLSFVLVGSIVVASEQMHTIASSHLPLGTALLGLSPPPERRARESAALRFRSHSVLSDQDGLEACPCCLFRSWRQALAAMHPTHPQGLEPTETRPLAAPFEAFEDDEGVEAPFSERRQGPS